MLLPDATEKEHAKFDNHHINPDRIFILLIHQFRNIAALDGHWPYIYHRPEPLFLFCQRVVYLDKDIELFLKLYLHQLQTYKKDK